MNVEMARAQMLGQQIRAWEVLDARVLSVLERTPREQFMPPEYRDLGFADTEIPIGHGQYTMAPKLEGRLLQALRIEPRIRHRVERRAAPSAVVWLAAEASHLPLVVEVDAVFGRVRMELTGYEAGSVEEPAQ